MMIVLIQRAWTFRLPAMAWLSDADGKLHEVEKLVVQIEADLYQVHGKDVDGFIRPIANLDHPAVAKALRIAQFEHDALEKS